MKKFKDYLGKIALFLAVPAFLPQVYKVYNTGETKSFSSRTLILYISSQIFWFLHALINLNDFSLMAATTINFSCFAYIIYRKYYNEGILPHKKED